MSAFIVNKRCMDNVVTAFSLKDEEELRGKKTTAYYTELGKRLYVLNWDAVNQRYGTQESGTEGDAYKWSPDLDKNVSQMQLLKSIHCLHYQCSEGNVPEKELFKELDRLEN